MCPSAGVPTPSTVTHPNAFVVLMHTQRVLQRGNNGLPIKKMRGQKRTSKIQWIDPATHGAAFVQKLCNVLWYVDGHRGTLSERGLAIPEALQCFTGYV